MVWSATGSRDWIGCCYQGKFYSERSRLIPTTRVGLQRGAHASDIRRLIGRGTLYRLWVRRCNTSVLHRSVEDDLALRADHERAACMGYRRRRGPGVSAGCSPRPKDSGCAAALAKVACGAGNVSRSVSYQVVRTYLRGEGHGCAAPDSGGIAANVYRGGSIGLAPAGLMAIGKPRLSAL